MLRGSTGLPFWKLKIDGEGIGRPLEDGSGAPFWCLVALSMRWEVLRNDAVFQINAALRLAAALQQELRHD